MIDFNFSGEKDFPECVISALSQWHLPTLSESFTCLCITAGDCFIQSRSAAWITYLFPLTLLAAPPLFLWINPSLTGTSPVQQSDCRQQSQRAACWLVFLPCMNTLPIQRLINKNHMQIRLFVLFVGFTFISIKSRLFHCVNKLLIRKRAEPCASTMSFSSQDKYLFKII